MNMQNLDRVSCRLNWRRRRTPVFRTLALIAGLAIAVVALAACSWGWADNSCNDSGCAGSNCAASTKYVLTTLFCQTQQSSQGPLCCECEEEAYRCVGANCSTAYWYKRTRWQTSGECAQAQNGLYCTF